MIDTYVNQDLSAVTVEFHLDIIVPACTLRVIDRFVVDDEGRITAQENFFDLRDVTNPGWRDLLLSATDMTPLATLSDRRIHDRD